MIVVWSFIKKYKWWIIGVISFLMFRPILNFIVSFGKSKADEIVDSVAQIASGLSKRVYDSYLPLASIIREEYLDLDRTFAVVEFSLFMDKLNALELTVRLQALEKVYNSKYNADFKSDMRRMFNSASFKFLGRWTLRDNFKQYLGL